MKTFLTLFASAALTLSAAAHADTPVSSLNEGFDDIGSLSGWTLNGSTADAWFQGNTGIFSAQAGAAGSYIASNYVTAGGDDQIDNWLITPEFTLNGTTRLTFYTRDSAEGDYLDNLSVLFSAGSGTDASGFTTTLLSIGGAAGYPDGWTQYTAEITGTGTGRFGFHYTGSYADASYIGIDSVAIAAVPEPSTWLMLGLGLGAVGFAARRSRRAAAGAVALAALGMSQGAMAHEPAKEQGLVVVRDGESGQLRAPTPEEYRALVPAPFTKEAGLARGAAAPGASYITKTGARGSSVAHKAVYSVLTRNADGTLAETCVTSEDAANAVINNTRTAQASGAKHEAQ